MRQLCDDMYMYADGMDAAQSADDDSDEDVSSDIDYFDDGGYATDDSLDEDSCEDDEESEDEESELEEEENYVNRGVKFMSIKYCNECHRRRGRRKKEIKERDKSSNGYVNVRRKAMQRHNDYSNNPTEQRPLSRGVRRQLELVLFARAYSSDFGSRTAADSSCRRFEEIIYAEREAATSQLGL